MRRSIKKYLTKADMKFAVKRSGTKNLRNVAIIVALASLFVYWRWDNSVRSFGGFYYVAKKTTGDGLWSSRIEKLYFSTDWSLQEVQRLASQKGLRMRYVEDSGVAECGYKYHLFVDGDNSYQMEYIWPEEKQDCVVALYVDDFPRNVLEDTRTALVQMEKGLYFRLR